MKWETYPQAQPPSPLLSSLQGSQTGHYGSVFDYRRLNAVTERYHYPLPRIDEVLRLVLGSKILSKIDIHQAFHGVEIEEKSRPLMTFRTTFGAWQWNVMPFGLSNAPSTWQ